MLTDLGFLEEGGTLAHVINDNNHVVGGSGKRGFVWSPDAGIRDVGDLGGGTATSFNINRHDVVVGESTTIDGDTHAFVFTNGEIRDLGTLGGSYSTAEEINDLGIIVGASRDADGVQHAYVGGPDRPVRRIPNLGGGEAYGVSVNSSGQVCGFSETRNGETHAFIYDEQRGIVDIGTLGGGYAEGWQMNDRGVVCGISKTERGETHGFVWIPHEVNGISGTMHDIGGFNGQGTYANYVSDEGFILAMTEDEDIPLFATIEKAGEPSISPLFNPFYPVSELTEAKDGFANEMRIQAPCAINRGSVLTGWGVRNGIQCAYTLTSVSAGIGYR